MRTRLGAPEGSPGEQRQAEAHHRGVQAVKLIFELEFVPGCMGQAALIHEGEQGLEKAGGPPVIGVGKGGAGHRLDSQMVKVGKPGFQDSHPIPQAGTGSDLHEDEVHQLVPTVK